MEVIYSLLQIIVLYKYFKHIPGITQHNKFLGNKYKSIRRHSMKVKSIHWHDDD